jgi:predicted ester cyclase
MTTFPDMIVTFDKLEPRGDRTAFHWTLTGTNTGPGGTGKRVRISGYELWKIDNGGLIAESKGNFDAADYERQLRDGFDQVAAIDLNRPCGCNWKP